MSVRVTLVINVPPVSLTSRSELFDDPDHRRSVLEQIPRLLAATATVLRQKAQGQHTATLLEDISPTALWMFNVRNLAVSVTVKFMWVSMSVTETTRQEHGIKDLLSNPLLQMRERSAHDAAATAHGAAATG